MNALFYENEDRASRLSLGSVLTLYEILRSWRSCHACSPVLLELSTKNPLSAACRRRKEWQWKEKKKRRGFGEPHWTAQADMLIAKLCKGDDCHNSAGGQNDPEPPLPLALHLSVVHSVQALISSTALQACNYLSWRCRTPVSCDSGSNMLLNYSPSRKLIITVMVSKDPNECCLSVWKQHHSIVALIVLWQLFDSQRMGSIIVNTRVKTQGKSSAKARTGKFLVKPREKNCRTRFHQVPFGFVSIQSTCSLTAAFVCQCVHLDLCA